MGLQSWGLLLPLTTKRQPRPQPLRDAAGLMAWVAVCCAAPAVTVMMTGSALAKLKAQWTIEGPPCEALVEIPRRLVSAKRPPKTFTYAGAQYVHPSGMAYCAELTAHPWWPFAGRFAVCQFNNPGAVSVRTGDTRATFAAPPGRRLTVTVRGGRASCVVGGWFAL